MSKSDPTVASPPSPGADDLARAAPIRPGGAPSTGADDVLASLTDKQRAVLDLLIEHKTSKEISRILGISHHTVDQRIMLARTKLGVATRGEVAQAYRRLRADAAVNASIYERSVYDFSDVAMPLDALQEPDREDTADWLRPQQPRTETRPRAAYQSGDALVEPYYHVLPEMFDGPYGTYVRLGPLRSLPCS